MSKTEILAELPNLGAQDCEEVFERLCELQDAGLVHGTGPSPEERRVLDEALADFERDKDVGKPWREVINRIRATGKP